MADAERPGLIDRERLAKPMFSLDMSEKRPCWLIVNPESGSCTPDSHELLSTQLEDRAWHVSRVIIFPEQALPPVSELAQDDVRMVMVCGGDGTASAVLDHLHAWDGEVLVLPGGTKNLLAARLHGTMETEPILDLVAAGAALARSITAVRHDGGLAFAELLVGPATSWHEVRETMRKGAVAQAASETIDALDKTTRQPAIHVANNSLGREAGYPLVAIRPGEFGLAINGYHAEQPLDFAAQAWATILRRFREGPHDNLGLAENVVLVSADGSTLSCLVDGEPAQSPSGHEFSAERTQTRLLVTRNDA